MRTLARVSILLTLTAVLGSCASPAKLAKRSEEAFGQGEYQKAYENARSALKKDPENERARRAMAAAADRLIQGRKEGILAVARYDTIGAARQCVDLTSFDRELADYRITPADDPDFEATGQLLRRSAAGIRYREGDAAMEDGRPKAAYYAFLSARDFEPTYLDCEARLREAFDAAVARVALLPFSNQTGIRGLPRELSDRVYAQVSRRINETEFPFTTLLGRDEVYSKISVADLDRMGRREAILAGRDLDADQVVAGRFYGLRSRTDTESYHSTIYRKMEDRDAKGTRGERYVPNEIDVVSRVRGVSVRYEFEVLSTRDGSVLSSGGDAVEVEAHALYTNFQAEGDADEYCIAPPDLKRSDPDRAKQAESQWKERCGSWTLAQLLERARKDRDRTQYRSSYRDEFAANTADRPVFLADLPPEDDLAIIALRDVWRPVLGALRDLDRK
jgi:hypothetical protein